MLHKCSRYVSVYVIGHDWTPLQYYKCNLMKLFLLKFIYQCTTSYLVSSNNEFSAICGTAYCDYWLHSLYSDTINITTDVWICSLLIMTATTNHNCIDKVIKRTKLISPPPPPLKSLYHIHSIRTIIWIFRPSKGSLSVTAYDRRVCSWFIIRGFFF